MAGALPGQPHQRSAKSTLNEAISIQNQDIEIISNMNTTLAQTEEVGTNIAATLAEDSATISRINDKALLIDDELVRAERYIGVMMRRLQTDKFILCLAFLVCVGILAMIIVAAINSANPTEPDPDKLPNGSP